MTVNAVNPMFEDAQFSVPKEYVEINETPFKAEYVAEHLIVVRGLGNPLYRALFIETEDGLIAMDALIAPQAARRSLDAAKALAGGKPLTHVVLSHFHSDHIGGYAAYQHEGVQFYGTEDVAEVLQLIAGESSGLFSPTGRGVEHVSIELVKGSVPISLPGTPLQIVNIGPTPHTRQLLIVYDPRTQTLINSDTYSSDTKWSQSMTHFANWVRESPFEIGQLAGVHHELILKTDLLTIADENSH